MVLLSGKGDLRRLVCAASPDWRVVDATMAAGSSFVDARGDAIFLGLDDDIVRMDLQER